MSPNQIREWREKVYHTDPKAKVPQSWRAVRGAILRRDHFKCFRCETGNRRILTVHHLVPRSEGGTDEHDNLITLCNDCHNLVEAAGCRSLLDIEGTIDSTTRQQAKELEPEAPESFERPAWHRWVYGGARHPES